MTNTSQLDKAARLFLLLGTFSLPLSTTGTTVSLLLAVLLVLFSGQWQQKIDFFVKQPALWIPVLLFLGLAVSTLHGITPLHDRLVALKGYHPLLMMPFLSWLLIEESIRKKTLYAFLAAMLVNIFITYYIHYFNTSLSVKGDSTPFHDHISIGIFAAFTVLTLVQLARTEKGFHQYGLWATVALTGWYTLFINVGRTGYLVFIALMILLGWQTFRWKGLALSCTGAAVLVLSLSFVSPVFQTSTQHAMKDSQLYLSGQKKADDTASLRIVSMKAALSLVKQHPLVGVGVGSFQQASLQLPAMTPELSTAYAYNDFLSIAVQTGVLIALLMWLMYLIQWQQFTNQSGFYARLGETVIITMVMSGLLNPVLHDAAEAKFYCVFIALCLAATQRVITAKTSSTVIEFKQLH